MISKELLSEVLQDRISAVGIIKFDDLSYTTNESYIDFYTNDNELYYNINIYELAHKCKEWAFTQGYKLSSQYVQKGKYTSSWCKVHEWVSEDNKFIVKYNSDTEPEAIFKACQWILDNKDKQ